MVLVIKKRDGLKITLKEIKDKQSGTSVKTVSSVMFQVKHFNVIWQTM